MYEPSVIKEAIKRMAKEKGVRMMDMYSACNVNSNVLLHMGEGSAMSYDKLARIADYLDCSLDSLLGRDTYISGLSPEEGQLVAAFRSLNTTGRQMLITTATAYTMTDNLTKDIRGTGTC